MAIKYIKDLLDLPAQVNKGDFVLNLAAGVSDANAAATLRNYVVTPQLDGLLRPGAGLHQGCGGFDVEQGMLPARQLRQRQEPLHGRAAPAAAGQPRRAGDQGTGRPWWPSTTPGRRGGSSCWCRST